MLGEDISRAMGDLPDEWVDQAANAYERKKRGRRILYRAAALAAALAIILTAALWPRETDDGFVTAPGVLKVYAYDLSTGEDISAMGGYDLTSSVVTESHPWFANMGMYYGLPLTLKINDERLEGTNVTFDVSVDHGSFYGDIKSDKYKEDINDRVAALSDADLGNVFSIENGESIFWTDTLLYKEASDVGMLPEEYLESIGNVIYTDVVINADDHIIGYAIIEIHYRGGLYTASVRNTVFFPMEDGKYQEITVEYVQQKIAQCKAK